MNNIKSNLEQDWKLDHVEGQSVRLMNTLLGPDTMFSYSEQVTEPDPEKGPGRLKDAVPFIFGFSTRAH